MSCKEVGVDEPVEDEPVEHHPVPQRNHLPWYEFHEACRVIENAGFRVALTGTTSCGSIEIRPDYADADRLLARVPLNHARCSTRTVDRTISRLQSSS